MKYTNILDIDNALGVLKDTKIENVHAGLLLKLHKNLKKLKEAMIPFNESREKIIQSEDTEDKKREKIIDLLEQESEVEFDKFTFEEISCFSNITIDILSKLESIVQE